MSPQKTPEGSPSESSREALVLQAEPQLPFVRDLQKEFANVIAGTETPLFMKLDKALSGLAIPGDKASLGKRIAYENKIREQIMEIPEGEMTSEKLVEIMKGIFIQCEAEPINLIEKMNAKIEKKETKIEKKETETAINIDKEENKQAENKKVETETKKTETETKKTETETAKKETEIAKKETETLEARKNAKANTNEIEKLLGGPEGLSKALGGKYSELLLGAIEKRKAERKKEKLPELNEEDLQAEVRTKLFLDNQAQIEKACPPADRARLSGFFDGLKVSAIVLNISYSIKEFKDPLPLKDQEGITKDPSFEKGKTIIRKGNELIARSSDGSSEIWNLFGRPPSKRVEFNGVSIDSRTQYKPNFEYLAMKSELETKKTNLQGTIKKGESHFADLQKIAYGLESGIQKDNIVKDSSISDMARELGLDIAIKDIEGKDKLVEVQKEMQETKQYIETFQGELEKTEANIANVEQEESSRVSEYQTAMRNETQSHRSNLQFLDSTGLPTIGQKGIDLVISTINQQRKIHGESSLILANPLSEQDKNALVRTTETLLGDAGKGLFKAEKGNLFVSPDSGAREKIIALLNNIGFSANLGNPTERIKLQMRNFNEHGEIKGAQPASKE